MKGLVCPLPGVKEKISKEMNVSTKTAGELYQLFLMKSDSNKNLDLLKKNGWDKFKDFIKNGLQPAQFEVTNPKHLQMLDSLYKTNTYDGKIVLSKKDNKYLKELKDYFGKEHIYDYVDNDNKHHIFVSKPIEAKKQEVKNEDKDEIDLEGKQIGKEIISDIEVDDESSNDTLEEAIINSENISKSKIDIDNTLHGKLHRWKRIKAFTAKEKRELSEYVIQNLSYTISNSFYNKLLDNDIDGFMKNIKVLEKYGLTKSTIDLIIDNKDSITRENFIRRVGFDKFAKLFRDIFINKNPEYADILKDNWDAIMFNGRNVLKIVEQLNITPSNDYEDFMEKDGTENADDSIDEYEGNEEEDSEAYDIKADNRSATNSLSKEIKNIIYTIPIQNSNSRFRLIRFENGEDIANKVLEMCSSAESVDEMFDRLRKKAGVYKWITPLIKRIEKTSSLKQKFFKNFRKSFIKRAVILKDSNGKPYLKIINYDEEITDVKLKDFKQLWENGFKTHIFNFGSEQFNGYVFGTPNMQILKSILSEDILNIKDVHAYQILLKWIGIDVNIDVLDSMLKDENKIEYSAQLMPVKDVLKNLINQMYKSISNIQNSNNPLFLQDANFEANARQIFELIKPYESTWIERSTIQKGKNYYAYIYPSFINDLVEKLKNVESLDDDEYVAELQEMFNDDYLISRNGDYITFKNELLNLFATNKTFRNDFEKMSLLTFEKGLDIEQMDAKKALYTDLAAFNHNYNSLEDTFTYYNCGVFSNKDQIQYMLFKRYKDLNSMQTPFYNVMLQEIDRIKDVIERAKITVGQMFEDEKPFVPFDCYDIPEKTLKKLLFPNINGNKKPTSEEMSKAINRLNNLTADDFKQLIKSGAVFKHLSFLNDALFDKNNNLSKVIIKAITKNNTNELEEEFKNIFNEDGLIVKFFDKEFEDIKDSLPNDGDSKMYDDEFVKNFLYNNFYANIQFSQIFQIDISYNKNAEDTQKRAAAFIAPGLKLDLSCTFKENDVEKRVTDGKMRTVVIDSKKVIANCIEVLNKIFDEKASFFFPKDSKRNVNNIKDIFLTRLKDVYNAVDVSDGQSWMSPTGYWKKIQMEGYDTYAIQKLIKQIRKGNFKLDDIATVLGEPQKPVVYGFRKMRNQSGNFKNKCIPTYIKDSEMTILLADAIIRGAKEDAILTGFFDVMEDSHYLTKKINKKGDIEYSDFTEDGIDNITMSSAVKTGLSGRVNLETNKIKEYKKKHKCSTAQAVKEIIESDIYLKNDKGEFITDKSGRRIYNENYVYVTSFNDYRIQQEVPPHLRGHQQQLGSQERVLSIIDIDPDTQITYFNENTGKFETKKGLDIQKEYLKLCNQYFGLATKELEEEFGLSSQRRADMLNAILKKLKDKDEKDRRWIVFKDLLKECRAKRMSYNMAFGVKDEQELGEIIKLNKEELKDKKGNVIRNKKGEAKTREYVYWKGQRKFRKGCLFNKLVAGNGGKNFTQGQCAYSEYEKALILSNILIKQLNSDSRYDSELLDGVTINEDGNFNIPLNDPINHSRTEQLICSIIKKGLNKQKIDGGPVVQASSYGLSNRLNVRYYKKGSNKELIMTKDEFAKSKDNSKYKDYQDYVNKEAGNLAYHEIAITIPWDDFNILNDLKENGDIITPQEAIDKGIITEEMLYGIGYRIPTENKSSIYPMKIVDFLPESTGSCILLPEEITAITGSDFDIDKTFVMFKSFHRDSEGNMVEDKYDENNLTKEGVNNRIFNIQRGIFSNESCGFLMHNPQGFENIRRAQSIAIIGKSNVNISHDKLAKMNQDELDDIIDENNIGDKNKNIHLTSTRLLFFKKNMEGRKILGMFANNNTAHAFCQLHNQLLSESADKNEKEGMYIKLNNIKLDGVMFDNDHKLYVDQIYNRKRTNYISSATGEFVGASADIAKDDVLSEFNANERTMNLLMLLIRAGFDHEFVCMFINQPIVKMFYEREQLQRRDIEYWVNDYKREHEVNDNDYDVNSFTTSELYDHLKDNTDDIYQYFIAKTLLGLFTPSKDFLTLSLECRYNSIKNGVGPSIIDNFISTYRHLNFLAKKEFTIANSKSIVEKNPLLNILYEQQYGEDSIIRRVLKKHATEYTNDFYIAFKRFQEMTGFLVNSTNAPYIKDFLNDYNMFRLTSNNINGKTDEEMLPFLIQDFDERNRLYNFTETFIQLKKFCFEQGINNDFINLLYLNDWGDLCMNAKRMKSLQKDNVKAAIEELYTLGNDTLKTWIEDCFLYFLQKQSFGFDPLGDTVIFPEYIKKNIERNGKKFYDYIRNVNYGIETPADATNTTFVDNFVYQFLRNNIDCIPGTKIHKNENYGPWMIGDNEFSYEREEIDGVVRKYIKVMPDSKGKFKYFTQELSDNKEVFKKMIKVVTKGGANQTLYALDEKRSTAAVLIYNEIKPLGNRNLREYNANENGLEMEAIPKIRKFVNPFNKHYDIRNLKLLKNGGSELYELADNKKIYELTRIYLAPDGRYKETGIFVNDTIRKELEKLFEGTKFLRKAIEEEDVKHKKEYVAANCPFIIGPVLSTISSNLYKKDELLNWLTTYRDNYILKGIELPKNHITSDLISIIDNGRMFNNKSGQIVRILKTPLEIINLNIKYLNNIDNILNEVFSDDEVNNIINEISNKESKGEITSDSSDISDIIEYLNNNVQEEEEEKPVTKERVENARNFFKECINNICKTIKDNPFVDFFFDADTNSIDFDKMKNSSRKEIASDLSGIFKEKGINIKYESVLKIINFIFDTDEDIKKIISKFCF